MRTSTSTCDRCKSPITPGQEFIGVSLLKEVEPKRSESGRCILPKPAGSKGIETFAQLELCMPCADKPLDLKTIEWETEEIFDP